LPNTGSIFVGTDGVLVLPHINRPLLYPTRNFTTTNIPMFLRAIIGVNSCRPAVAKATPPRVLNYAGPLTEAVLLAAWRHASANDSQMECGEVEI